MALSTFNDGDPIDAASLSNIITELNKLKATNMVAGDTTIKLEGASEVVVPKIYGGKATKVSLKPNAYTGFTITYPDQGKIPNAIILTPVKQEKPMTAFQAFVDSSTIGQKSAKCWAYLPAGYKAHTTDFFYMVITHN